jgi:hypothetical protein
MKPKVIPLVLSFAVLLAISSSVNAKPIDRTKIANGPSVTKIARPKPISQWQFVNANNDLRVPHTRQSFSDWNRIAILSKPYRSGITGLKPFSQWAFENIRVDLGASYTAQQKVDWDAISILSDAPTPYRFGMV